MRPSASDSPVVGATADDPASLAVSNTRYTTSNNVRTHRDQLAPGSGPSSKGAAMSRARATGRLDAAVHGAKPAEDGGPGTRPLAALSGALRRLRGSVEAGPWARF